MTAGMSYDIESAEIQAARCAGNCGTRTMVGAFARMPLLCEPGTRWIYSLAHDVLGGVIESVSGETLGDYFQNHLFEPLGISDMYFTLDQRRQARLSVQYEAEPTTHDIASGHYKDGEALLTEAELKQKFGVSRQTVRQAISLLENDGLVIRRRGSGTYVNHGARKHSGMLNVGVITTYITDYIFPSIVRGIESALSAESCIMSLSATYNRTDHDGLARGGATDEPDARRYAGLFKRKTLSAQTRPQRILRAD